MYPNDQQKRPMLRTPAAEHICGSSTSTSKTWPDGGGLRYVKLGRRGCYDPADLDAWLATKRRGLHLGSG